MSDTKLTIKVITGSVREGRFNTVPAKWIVGELQKRDDIDVELLDLAEYEMPFFNAAETPMSKDEPYTHPVVVRWTAKIAEADGFVFVTPEYNHGTSGVLKNAIDWVGPEWGNKAVGFVSYGGVGGARVVEHLRCVCGELQMADVRSAIHIPGDKTFPMQSGDINPEDYFPTIERHADSMIGQLTAWARALRTVREAADV